MDERKQATILCAEADGWQTLALLEDGALLEYSRQPLEAGEAGNLVLGRVERVVPALGAAFVQIGQARNGFLPLRESEAYRAQNPNDADTLHAGSEVLVQVQKEAHGEKGAALTRDVALAGSYLLFLPNNRHVGCSKRVTDEADRERLLRTARALAGGSCGLVLRHSALEADERALADELDALRTAWENARKVAPYRKAPAVLYRPGDALDGLLRDLAPKRRLLVRANLPVREEWRGQADWEQLPTPDAQALLMARSIQESLRAALRRRVQLPGGATLVIDECEALTAIDVNSAANTQGGPDFALRQNRSVCAEIARQLRLRAIGGIVLVDFVDMPTDEQRAEVARALAESLADDRAKVVLHGFTALGLMELTRKRTRRSLREQLTLPCERCLGEGRTEQPKEAQA